MTKKKAKKWPGESDSIVFARVASRAVHAAREDNQGELGQSIEPKQVHIYMEGGIIQDIEYPAGVKILVYDYDVEGADADRIEKDGRGDDCIITRYDIK